MIKKGISLFIVLLMLLSVISVLPLHAAAEENSDDAETSMAETGLAETGTKETEVPSEAATDPTEGDQTDIAPEGADISDPTIAPTGKEQAKNYPLITGFENLSNGTKITWDSYKKNKIYRVYYRKAATYKGTWKEKYGSAGWTRIATVKGNSYTHTDIGDGEIGIYTVRCVDDKGNFTSEYNKDGWEHCYYAPPVISSIDFDEKGVHISWKYAWEKHGKRNGECYRVYRKTASSSWSRIAENAHSVFTDATAVPGVTYTYTLRMTNEDGDFISDHNGGKTVSFSKYPVITDIVNTDSGTKLTWQTFSGASQYRVYYRSSDGWTRIAQVRGTSYTDTSSNRVNRVYTIRAVDNSGNFVSDFKKDGWSNNYYKIPSIKSISSATGGVKVTWDRPKDAQDFRVYRKTSDGWQRLTQTSASEYIDKNVSSGKSYTYTIRMVTTNGKSFMSDPASSKSITYVAAPKITSATNLSDGVHLTWNKSAGADFYRIYYWNGSSWTRLASKYLTEYTDKSVKDGETREYTIRCLDENENFVSDYYRDGYINTFYAPPVISNFSFSESGTTIEWKRAKGAQDYRVYRKDGSSWTRLTQTSKSSYTDTTAKKKGVKYTYTLRMVTSDGSRFMSDHTSGSSITGVNTPRFSSLTSGEKGVNLSWKTVSGASIYRLYYRTSSSSSWIRLATLRDATTFCDTRAVDGKSRTYTIRCVNFSGDLISDYLRDGQKITYYAPPEIDSINCVDGKNVLTWTQRAGVSSYSIYRKTFPSTEYTEIASSVIGLEYTDDSTPCSSICAYSIRSNGSSGKPLSEYDAKTPFFQNGVLADGSITSDGDTYQFSDGYPVSGYATEGDTIRYYSGGVEVIPSTNYLSIVKSSAKDRTWWLYTLMSATSGAPNCVKTNGTNVFAAAKQRGIIDSYSSKEFHSTVTRRFLADTMVNALQYPNRSVGTVSDITSSEKALSTLAYYGYFIPDSKNRLFPDSTVTNAEFAKILSDLDLYKNLCGKTVLSFGDSIMNGQGNSAQGPGKMIAEKYGMTCYDYSVPGAVTGSYGVKSHIPHQVRSAIAVHPHADLILFNGGTNDFCFSVPFGEISEGQPVDEDTFVGGFVTAVELMQSAWRGTPIIYVRSHNMKLGSDYKERLYGEKGLELAQSYSVAAIDLYNRSGLNTENQAMCNRYTLRDTSKGDNYYDSIHPNALGYAEFYLPYIKEVLDLTYLG